MKSTNSTTPDTSFTVARRLYFESLLNMGFTLLRLYKVRDNGECTCSPYSPTRDSSRAKREEHRRTGNPNPCGNPGKHLVGNASKAVLRDIKKIEHHLDNGGSVGLCMRMKTLPGMPLRLLVFDCDRDGAPAWLEERGIRSPLEVPGKRGKHVYLMLPDDVPDLLTDTRTLNPWSKNPTTNEQPGIDIKVSGLVVAPYSRNKRLFLNGEDISQCPDKVRTCFESLDALRGLLPTYDPRILAPFMRTYSPGIAQAANVAPGSHAAAPPLLSSSRVGRIAGSGDSRELPYHYRRGLAKRFLGKAQPAIEGRHPNATMFRVVCTLMKHYWLSEADAYELIGRFYNHRCLDAEGESYPYLTHQLVGAIQEASKPDIHDPIGVANAVGWEKVSLVNTLARLKKRDNRSNLRRQKRSQDRATMMLCSVRDHLLQNHADPNRSEVHSRFRDVHHWVNHHVPMTSRFLRGILLALGYRIVPLGASKCPVVVGITIPATRLAA